ncbi:uncharacterized protein LOC129803424 [Phlebotomus papatasi]|uniref:uncharacterized protein LOC129803424 n=1 Tax=Phlebotomus papatasi TaxID=29031 RepID=UPI002483AA6C|nr:uncharacterized protein LOC129803424 [Phlebotomus papatasi]
MRYPPPIPDILQKPDNRSLFLQILLERDPTSKIAKYEDDMKKFCTNLFLISGRGGYRTLAANLPLPSTSTVYRTVYSEKQPPSEGKLRIEEFEDFLYKHKAPRLVWLSEDATRLTGKIEYCQTTNTIVGFVIPLSSSTGLPHQLYFPATSLSAILNAFRKGIPAKQVNIIMAKPLSNSVPAFCLVLYGANSVISHTNAKIRWEHVVRELRQNNIDVVGISTDGDSRYLKAMRLQTEIRSNLAYYAIHKMTAKDLHYIQDPVHILTKLRTRLLNENVSIIIGSETVDLDYLRKLLDMPKDLHGLNLTDISPADKMNFKSCEKLIHDDVTDILEQTFPQSKALVMYLKIMRLIYDSFLATGKTALERIFAITRVVYSLRIWRDWLVKNRKNGLTLKHFITTNSYMCIEMNAISLIEVVRRLRDNNQEEYFHPQYFSSQPCEEFFRHLRSLSTTKNTVVNFSLLDVFHRVRRIELQSEITNTLKDKGFSFPSNSRAFVSQTTNNLETLPSDDQIIKFVEYARKVAKKDMERFGIKSKNEIPLHLYFKDEPKDKNEQKCPPRPLTLHELEDPFTDRNIKLKNYADKNDCKQLSPTSKFVEIKTKRKRIHVRKSTVCWLLTQQVRRLSSDRTCRFSSGPAHEIKKKNKKFKNLKEQKYRKRRTRTQTNKKLPK